MARFVAATVLLLSFFLASPAWAGAPADDTDKKRLVAAHTAAPPKIDGRLDEPAWAAASVASDFTQRFPDEGALPTERTEVRALYDNRALYLGVRCFDRNPKEIARLVSRRDAVPESDSITVSIDSMHDHLTARSFTVNAAGVQGDSMLFGDTERNDDWDAVWSAEVQVDEQGWTAELAIPWRALPYRSGQRIFGFNITRNIFRTKETSSWVHTPRADVAGVSRFGHLEVDFGPSAARSIEIAPWAGASWGHEAGGERWGASAGIDARFGLTPDLRLDLTANPDFGQIEADPAILNLSTIELFFPEKRPFFLEGAHLFQPPGESQTMQLFYSRRIGRAPPDPTLADGETQLGLTQPAPIAGALKLTGQAAPGWNVAAIEALTLPTYVAVQRADGVREERQLAPTTNFVVLRAARDVPYGTVGATFTSARPIDGGLSSCGSGETPVGGHCARGAETAGFDLRLRPGDYVVAAQLVGSRVSQGPDLAVADGTVIRAEDAGVGAQLKFAKENGENLLFSVQAEYESPRLDLDEIGYLERQNNLFEWGHLVLRTLKPRGILREGEIVLDLRARQEGVRTRLWEDAQLQADVTFSNFWLVGIGGHVMTPWWDCRDLHNGALLWKPPYFGGWVWFNTDARKLLYTEGSFYGGVSFDDRFGQFYDVGGDAKLVLRPAARWETQVLFSFEHMRDTMRYISAGDGVFHLAPVDWRSTSLTLRQMVALTPSLVLQGYAQIFFASGKTLSTFAAPIDADPRGQRIEPGMPGLVPDDATPPAPWFHDSRLNVTLVLRWEYLPGSSAYLVYQRAQLEAEGTVANGIAPIRDLKILGAGRVDDRIMIKISWWLGV